MTAKITLAIGVKVALYGAASSYTRIYPMSENKVRTTVRLSVEEHERVMRLAKVMHMSSITTLTRKLLLDECDKQGIRHVDTSHA